MNSVTINIGKEFSRYPVGRYVTDGDFNGQRFREEYLLRHLVMGTKLVVQLDDALGYGSSFLEEAFGGLVRGGQFTSDQVLALIEFETEDDSLLEEIKSYIKEARN